MPHHSGGWKRGDWRSRNIHFCFLRFPGGTRKRAVTDDLTVIGVNGFNFVYGEDLYGGRAVNVRNDLVF